MTDKRTLSRRLCAYVLTAPALIAYWESTLARMTATEDWKKNLERNVWVNSYTGADGSRKILRQQYDQMRTGLAELGLAKP